MRSNLLDKSYIWHVSHHFDLLWVIPNISTFFSCPGLTWIPYFIRAGITFLRWWMCHFGAIPLYCPCLCLFHLSLSYLQTPCTPLTGCSSTATASSPPPSPPYFPSYEESPGVAFELRAEPILPPALQVAFLNRGNVRSDICCSLLHSYFSKNVPWLHTPNNEPQKAKATPSNTKVGWQRVGTLAVCKIV